VAETERTARTAVHPLDPLIAEEITTAARIIRAHENFGEGHRFTSIALHEPPKEKVLAFRSSRSVSSTATRPWTCRRPKRTGTAGTRGESGTG